MLDQDKKYRIMIETTNICNANCYFCANPNLKRPKMVMSDEVFDLIVNKAIEENLCIEKFILHLNGEPFVDPKIFDRITKLKRCWSNVPVGFTTNFSIPSFQDIDKLFCVHIDFITISLNSCVPEEYERIMGLKFEKTISNIEYFIEKNHELGNPIVIRLSVVDDGKSDAVEKIKSKFGNKVEIRVMKMGRWLGKGNGSIDASKRQSKQCRDLNEQICILSNGEFALCCFDAEGIIGKNILESGLLEGFNSKVYKEVRAQFTSGKGDNICSGCSFSFE